MTQPHTTQNELDFLDRLKGNAKALKGYLVGSSKRVNWDAINRSMVVGYATGLLNIAESGVKP